MYGVGATEEGICGLRPFWAMGKVRSEASLCHADREQQSAHKDSWHSPLTEALRMSIILDLFLLLS